MNRMSSEVLTRDERCRVSGKQVDMLFLVRRWLCEGRCLVTLHPEMRSMATANKICLDPEGTCFTCYTVVFNGDKSTIFLSKFDMFYGRDAFLSALGFVGLGYYIDSSVELK